jgi:hypothetical protein
MTDISELPGIIARLYHQRKIDSLVYDIHRDTVTFSVEFTLHLDEWHNPKRTYCSLDDRVNKLEDNAGYDNGRILGLDARISILEHQVESHKVDHMPSPRDLLKGP